MSPDRPRPQAVFDYMVFLQAADRRESPSGACILLVELELVELCLSAATLAEVRDVLSRPELLNKFSSLTEILVEEFIDALHRKTAWIPTVPRVLAFDRDSKDEPWINLAIAAQATFLVSRDKEILDLARPSDSDGARLRKIAPSLRILDPVQFLREIRKRETH